MQKNAGECRKHRGMQKNGDAEKRGENEKWNRV